MTLPPSKLKSLLMPLECVQLRSETGEARGMLEYTEIMRRAVRGEIEGVCSATGRLRYVRELAASAREVIPDERIDIFDRCKSQPLNAITNMGAYRQHLENGVAWALCLCKGLDGARS